MDLKDASEHPEVMKSESGRNKDVWVIIKDLAFLQGTHVAHFLSCQSLNTNNLMLRNDGAETKVFFFYKYVTGNPTNWPDFIPSLTLCFT